MTGLNFTKARLQCGCDVVTDKPCEKCCDHTEIDHDEGNHCLACGTDMTESVMAAAYDRAKDARKYGDT
jgi:hypothetical protein